MAELAYVAADLKAAGRMMPEAFRYVEPVTSAMMKKWRVTGQMC